MSKWQLELKHTIKTFSELFKLLNLDVDLTLFNNNNLNSEIYNLKFPLLVTKSFVNRIKPNDINDPLLLQLLPNIDFLINPNLNLKNFNNYVKDPLQEKAFNYIPGLIHKYHGRVLLLSNKSCAIHCRYCFRQNFPYTHNIASGNNLKQIINYINNDNSIEEVILSGGDPLLAPNKYFKKLLNTLENIPHLTTIRLHSRVPIVLPSRLEKDLINIFSKSRLKIVLVIHSNHPNEINTEVAKYFNKINKNKIILLNQSVLLKNINDNPVTLAKLSKKLFDLKVLPYYLHILDPVIGAEHFEVNLQQAKKIYTELAAILPGYLLPKLVIEKPGAKNKILIAGNSHV